MAYENLLKSVEESATERERELREKARVAIEEIEAHSRKQAEEVQQSYLSGAEKSAEVEKNKLLYLTKGENKELIITIKEKIFSSAFHEAGQQLSAVRERPGYPGIFEKLVHEAIGAVGEDRFSVHIDKRDEELLKRTLSAMGVSCEVFTDLECAGGLVVSSPDGSVVISNTIESRLKRAQERKRHGIYSILFGV
jgi:V/A-type H+-transporting ATPase subunit E